MAESSIPTTPSAARKPGNPLVRTCLFWLGALLVVVSPLVGAIPGPGGVFVFAAGAGLMLKNSKWAKKLYARFKKHHPKKGAWADWSLRRQSAARRVERDRLLAASADVAAQPPEWDTAPPGAGFGVNLSKPGDGRNG